MIHTHHEFVKALVVEHQQELERNAASWRLARRVTRPLRRQRSRRNTQARA